MAFPWKTVATFGMNYIPVIVRAIKEERTNRRQPTYANGSLIARAQHDVLVHVRNGVLTMDPKQSAYDFRREVLGLIDRQIDLADNGGVIS